MSSENLVHRRRRVLHCARHVHLAGAGLAGAALLLRFRVNPTCIVLDGALLGVLRALLG
jgi:hypothetical protein